ncbi:hypothetical protein [Nitratifractor sp.]
MKFVSRVLLPLLLLLYIGYETWLKLHHESLCGATGCKLAGELLRFPSLYLNYMGMAAVGAILILGILSLKKTAFERLFFIGLYAAIAFESIMIGYQIFANPEPCLFCLGVYGGLLLIALTGRPRWFLYALPAIAAIFFALGDLAIPRNAALIQGDGLYLIASDHCPHCKKVKAYFAEHKIDYHLLPVSDPSVRHLAKALGIDEIPILLRREGGKTLILYGDRPIISSFEGKSQRAPTPKAPMPSTTEELYGNPEAGGCSLSPVIDNGGGCREDPAKELKLR